MLTRIPLMLAWQCHDGSADAIYAGYLRHAMRNLDAWLTQEVPEDLAAPSDERLLPLYEALPARSRERFLTAPETYRRIIRRGEPPRRGTVGFVSNSLCAEHCLLDPESYALSEPLWTALGDVCFTPGRALQQSCAPRVGGKIVVDAVSPYSYVATASVSDETTHSPEEVRHVLSRLNEAVTGMGAVCPSARDLLTLVAKVVALRKDADDPQQFGSCSWAVHIGKIELTNAHLGYATATLLANALVHEAIHALLDMVDLIDPFYLDDRHAVEFSITSPWSGRPLPARIYLHACFVWFGLWCFWRLARETSVFPACETEKRLARSAAGFRAGSILAVLSPVRPYLAPTLLHALEVVEATVTAQ